MVIFYFSQPLPFIIVTLWIHRVWPCWLLSPPCLVPRISPFLLSLCSLHHHLSYFSLLGHSLSVVYIKIMINIRKRKVDKMLLFFLNQKWTQNDLFRVPSRFLKRKSFKREQRWCPRGKGVTKEGGRGIQTGSVQLEPAVLSAMLSVALWHPLWGRSGAAAAWSVPYCHRHWLGLSC